MATGTGKTLTSLMAAEALLKKHRGVQLIVIAVPFQHLADQWAEEFRGTDFMPIKAYKSTAKWTAHLSDARRIYKHLEKPLVVLTTYSTLASQAFYEAIQPNAENALLIADECHYLGAPSCRRFMALPIPFRLGLSATPERHFDEEGTNELIKYFGSIVYEFEMKKAIEAGYLTPYNYYPEIVELTYEESEKYVDLSERIARAAAKANENSDPDVEEWLKYLLIKRARVVNNASNKLSWLRSKLSEKAENDLGYTLVYTEDELFPEVIRMLGKELRVPVHAFTGKESANKRK